MSASDRTVTMTAKRETAMRRAMTIHVETGADAGKTHEVAVGPIVVGRAEGVEVRLADPTVSQFHVELDAIDDTVFVSDLGSSNGTFAGEIAIDRGRVPAGTRIRLGDTVLAVALGAGTKIERSKATSFGALVGASPAMREVYGKLERLARASTGVLIEGERGTGKELAARALHENGPRHAAPFLAVDCVAIAPSVTGSLSTSILGAAAGGTVFFDEVGDLSLVLQSQLLDALPKHDVRVVGSTSRSLRELVNRGAFLEGLYLRLAQARIHMPALLEHAEDIKPLVQHFLSLLPFDARAARAIEPGALEALARRTYAGNVRELRAVVERAALLAGGPTIESADLAFGRALEARRPSDPLSAEAPIESFKEAKRTVIDEFEREYLERLLSRAGTNVSKAAALAGIERQSLRDLLKRHGLREE
ncbi:MAG: sigma 54-interacting transcriptional regulator [Labilithrix sp.]